MKDSIKDKSLTSKNNSFTRVAQIFFHPIKEILQSQHQKK
jgi:hypothetical protein